MKNTNHLNFDDNISGVLNTAVRLVYSEHPHECNMLLYTSLAFLFAFGAYNEYLEIARSA